MYLAGNYCYRINAIAPREGLGDVGVLDDALVSHGRFLD